MRLELKVCERCGAIWLRLCGSTWVYCRPCTPVVRQMATRRSLLFATRVARKRKVVVQ